MVSLLSFDEDARRRAVRVDFSGGVDDPRFGGGGAVAGVNDDRFAADFADFAPQRPDVVDLEFERREGAAGGLTVLIAQPSAVSRSVAAQPPCATPMPL